MLKTYWSMSLHRAEHGHVRGLPTEYVIRHLRLPDDVAPIAALYGLAFGEEPWDLEWYNFAGFDAEGVFLTWRGDELAGFVISYVQPEHPERGYISVMATAPCHRRRGIASALMSTALDRFWGMGFGEAAVDVAEDNAVAMAAYEKIGFRKVGEFIADEHCRVPPESAAGPGQLRHHLKPLLAEVLVEGEHLPDVEPAHDLEGDAVHETKVTAVGGQEGGRRSLVDLPADALDGEKRNNALNQIPDGLDPQTILEQGHCLEDYVVRGDDLVAGLTKAGPGVGRDSVCHVLPVKERVQRGGVGKGHHCP